MVLRSVSSCGREGGHATLQLRKQVSDAESVCSCTQKYCNPVIKVDSREGRENPKVKVLELLVHNQSEHE